MPGLVGCASNRLSNPGLLKAMVKPMLHRADYKVHQHVMDGISVATVDLVQDQRNGFIQSRDKRFMLIFYGALYETWSSSKESILQNLLNRWTHSGWHGLADLNGEYLVLVWDSAEERLTIVNDRLGLKRLNYCQENGFFAFASEVKSLAVIPEVNRKIDVYGLSELLTFGHLQDDRTLLQDVKLLPMASCLTWRRGKLNISEYWQYKFLPNCKYEDSQEAVEAFAYYFKNAVARRIKHCNRIGLFLSGGLDSRSVGGWVRKIEPQGKLMTWTSGHGHDHDSRFAKQIAKMLNSEHRSVAIPESFLEDLAPFYAWALDGMVSAHGAHRSVLMQAMQDQCDVILCGYLGDTVGGDKRLDTFAQASDLEELCKVGFSCFPLGFTDELFQKTLKSQSYRQIQGFAFARYAESVKNASAEHLADKGIIAELNQRQRLWNPICQMELMELDAYTAVPFTDKEYVNFALSLPFEERCYKKVYVQMIIKYLPEVARICRSGEGLPLVHSRLRASLHWRRVLFNRYQLPKLTFGKLGGHNYAAFVHCAEWFQKSNANFIRKKLINNPILEEHFRMDALNELVHSFLNNTAEKDLMDSVSALMSYVLFRERLDNLSVYQPQSDSSVLIANAHQGALSV
jgi:asparagine synthase (glutamine-hydrolysing)